MYLHQMAGDRRNFDPPLNSSGEPELSAKVHSFANPSTGCASMGQSAPEHFKPIIRLAADYSSCVNALEPTFSGGSFLLRLFTLDPHSPPAELTPLHDLPPLFTFCGGDLNVLP